MKKKKVENKESYYMNIPATVWDTELNPKAILCYGHITVLANKQGFCYASNSYFERVLKISTSALTRYLNELEELQLIRREIIYKPNSKEVDERRIYMNIPITMDEHRPIVKDKHRPIVKDEQDNTTSNNNINNNNILDDDWYGKIFFKIVDSYPANRIGNRQHGLKKFKLLTKDNAKLSATNLKRYLATVNEPRFIKSLQNYIVEECFSEKWLIAEETKNNKQNINKNNVTNAKSFTDKNRGFYD